MNEGLHDFKLWFDGFVAAAGDGLDTRQWATLKRHVEMLTLDPGLVMPRDVIGGYGTGRLYVPKDAPSSMSGENEVVVPRYPDEKPV